MDAATVAHPHATGPVVEQVPENFVARRGQYIYQGTDAAVRRHPEEGALGCACHLADRVAFREHAELERAVSVLDKAAESTVVAVLQANGGIRGHHFELVIRCARADADAAIVEDGHPVV